MPDFRVEFVWPEGVSQVVIPTDLGIVMIQKNGMGFIVNGSVHTGIGLVDSFDRHGGR